MRIGLPYLSRVGPHPHRRQCGHLTGCSLAVEDAFNALHHLVHTTPPFEFPSTLSTRDDISMPQQPLTSPSRGPHVERMTPVLGTQPSLTHCSYHSFHHSFHFRRSTMEKSLLSRLWNNDSSGRTEYATD